jgi:hypothetical protein
MSHRGERSFGWLLDPRGDESPVIVDRVGSIRPELPAPGLPQTFVADPAHTTRGIEVAREA